MGMILIYGIIALLLFGLCAPIIYLILKRYGKPKLGKIIASIILIIALCFLFMNQIDENLISNSDVNKDLKLANINLKDDFKIIKNEVIGFPERFQNTEIKITENDQKRIVNEIKGGNNFKKCDDERNLYYSMIGKNSKKIVSNYSIKNKLYREFYEMNEGYVAVSIIIMVNEKSNILELNRIED